MQKTITFPNLLNIEKGTEHWETAERIYQGIKEHLKMETFKGQNVLIASGTGEDGQVGIGDLIICPYAQLAGISVDHEGEDIYGMNLHMVDKDTKKVDTIAIFDFTMTSDLEKWARDNNVTILAE